VSGLATHAAARHPFAGLFTRTGARSRRASSWDRSGGNRDWITVGPGEVVTLLEQDGPGCINHIYCTTVNDLHGFRDGILRCYWDGEPTPSVEVPIGEFFGLVHGRVREFASALLAVNAGNGGSHGLNSYFPMPFGSSARVTLENRSSTALFRGNLWYHIDFETFDDPLPADVLRLHAQYRQERPTTPVGDVINTTHGRGLNLDGRENYVALDAQGAGQMVGLLLEIRNSAGGWYGEGDDMVFIDGEAWPPSLHGTGTEEVFGGGACPNVEYAGPYTGFHLVESPTFDGLIGMYRWYVADPIRFTRSLRWAIEHGHANNYGNEYASVAWWYQSEPHAPFPPLPSREAMLPFVDADQARAEAAFEPDTATLGQLVWRAGPSYRPAVDAYFRGEWARALAELDRAKRGPSA
jgi:hypothetical protein